MHFCNYFQIVPILREAVLSTSSRGAGMIQAILRVLIAWVPFLGRLFPGYAECSTPKDDCELPATHVAVIGAGVGGCFAANFLRELGGQKLEIHVWNKKGSHVGGRTATTEFAGHTYETGACIMHSSNRYLVNAAKKHGLAKKGELDPSTPVGIFNGTTFSFRTGTSKIINAVKTLWRYGWSIVRMNFAVKSELKKFQTIYTQQDSGKSFATAPDMLKAMGQEGGMYSLTQVTGKKYFIDHLGLSERLVEELIIGAMRANYGQSVNTIDAFTAYVSLAGIEDGSLWSVVGGNWKIPFKLLEASGATIHEDEVTAVTRVDQSRGSDGKVQYKITTEAGGDVPGNFDVVIVANPLNTSKTKFENFPTDPYTAASMTPYHRTVAEFIQGQINTNFFGVSDSDRNFPMTILTEELEGAPFNFCSIDLQIPSEITQDEVKEYTKPVTEDPVRVWKVFVPEPLTEEQKEVIFSDIKAQATFDWLAYPEYKPPEEFPPFILDDGVFYINAIEKAASAMEMSAIGAKNAALLAREYLLK